ncbi:MAG: hypothetical protein Q9199_005935 [Rusavskia elegans]
MAPTHRAGDAAKQALHKRGNGPNHKNAPDPRKRRKLAKEKAKAKKLARAELKHFLSSENAKMASALAWQQIQRLQVKLHEDATPDFDVITSDAVTAGDIACVVRRTAHMPRGKLVSDELENLIYQEDYLLRYINDHDTPIAMLANAIRKGLVGGKSAIAKFLSLGPNVDGQTALCKALGNLFFSTESAVLRFDMSDFREKHTITLTIASATNAPAADITPPAATPAATPAAPPTAPIAVAIAPPVVTTVCRHNNLLAIALHHLSNDTLRARLQARIVNKRALARPKDGHMLLSSSTYKVSISV